jgi:hypothetical protein
VCSDIVARAADPSTACPRCHTTRRPSLLAATAALHPPNLTTAASHCFCGSRDEIRLDLHRTFVPLLPPFLPLYCETDCCGQLRRAPCLLHAAGADLVGARASAVLSQCRCPCLSLHQRARSYSLRNPILGYCQGLNFIAGLFLMYALLLCALVTVSLLLTLFPHVC